MMTLEQESRRGFEAQRLLENEIFKEAFASVRASILKTWEDAPIRDREAHHELKLMLKLLKDLEATITRVVNDGKKAQFEIETIKKRDEIARKVSRFS